MGYELKSCGSFCNDASISITPCHRVSRAFLYILKSISACYYTMSYCMTEDMEPFWLDIGEIAESLKIPAATLAQWKHRNCIPPSAHYEIIQRGAVMNIKVSHKQLHDMWKTYMKKRSREKT